MIRHLYARNPARALAGVDGLFTGGAVVSRIFN